MGMGTDPSMAEQLLGSRKGLCYSLGTQCVGSPSYGNRKLVVVEAVGFYWTELCPGLCLRASSAQFFFLPVATLGAP